MDFNDIRIQLTQAGGEPGEPAYEDMFAEFERKFGVSLSAQVRSNYLLMNGSSHYTAPGESWMRFWPLEDWRRVHEVFPDDAVAKSLSRHTFLCADYAYECVYFAIDLASTSGRVFGLGQNYAGIAGSTFAEFVERVAENSDEVHSYG